MQEQAVSRKKQSFLHGALILTVGILIVKVIGALFKIPLSWILGEDGLGYFNTAYTFYSPIFSLATAGFPIAIARMVSEYYARRRYRDVCQIHRASIPIFITTGTIGTLIMIFGTPIYTGMLDNPNSAPSMYALAPALLFSCLMSIYRGYYEGLSNMYPTAISEIIEAVFKLVIGLGASFAVMTIAMNEFQASGTVFGAVVASEEYAKSAALPYASAGAVLGVSLGSLFGYFYMLIQHKRAKGNFTKAELAASPRPRPFGVTVVQLIKVAIPIGLGALVVNISSLIDTAFLQTRIADIMNGNPQALLSMYEGMIPQLNLDAGTVPNYLYGCFSMALTLFMLVPSITQAFGISALPSVTTAWTKGNKRELKKSIEAVLRITALFSIPAGLGMAVLAGPITRLIYGDRISSPITSRVLVIMGLGAIFSALSTPLNSMLQAVGRVDLPVKLLAVGLGIKIILNYILVGIPEVNILGAGAGTLVCYALITILAVIFLCKESHVVPNFVSVFIKPLLASGLCAVAGYASHGLLALVISDRIATCVAIVIAIMVYVIALFCFRAIKKEDVMMLPKGQKIVKILEKRNWIG